MANRSGIEALLDLLDEAFRGRGIEASNESQALLTNLESVPDDAWRALPPGAARSIEAIAKGVFPVEETKRGPRLVPFLPGVRGAYLDVSMLEALAETRREGGLAVLTAVLNEPAGLRDVALAEMPRKTLRRVLDHALDHQEAGLVPVVLTEVLQGFRADRDFERARVLLVQPSTIPKTSSGKIQHSRLVQMIQGGELRERVVVG